MVMAFLCTGRLTLKFARRSVFTVTTNFTNLRPASAMSSGRLVWIDMEMTGLNPDEDHIMEVACKITDGQLNEIAGNCNLVIHQPDEILENMNDWCKINHGKSGLTEQCRKSTTTLQAAEEALLQFVTQNVPKGACPVAGNSVYMDRYFLMKHMPKFNEYMHYRIVDVSSVKEIARRWAPDVCERVPKKKLAHRALDDISDSIEELKFYKTHLFQCSI